MQSPGGARGNRTPDLYHAIVALSQLSYDPYQMKSTYESSSFLASLKSGG